MQNKPTMKQRMRKIKKVSKKKIEATKVGIKTVSNINRYNKHLFILETILFVGVVDEFFETLILKLDFGLYLNILLFMLSIGILFSLALRFIEPMAKGTITWLVRISNNKIFRVVFHLLILGLLFWLYARVFFNVNLTLSFNIGVNAG